jgi:Raf kinase inhibitor-like YbhB/YbcL family protein
LEEIRLKADATGDFLTDVQTCREGDYAMRIVRFGLILTLSCACIASVDAGQPPLQAPQRGAAPPSAPGGQRGGGRGRGAVQVMTLTTSAWTDGGQIAIKYTQAGEEVSPPLTWSNVPEGVVSLVLIAHDLDGAVGNGTDDLLHWLLWNIPGNATSLPEHVPTAPQLPDGTRQISATGPNYRGPGAAAAGPAHHYVFELFALDVMLDIPAVGAAPPQTRAAVLAAMGGHVRGKAACVGLFRRPG